MRLTGIGEPIAVVEGGNTVVSSGCTGILVKYCCDSGVYDCRGPGMLIDRIWDASLRECMGCEWE